MNVSDKVLIDTSVWIDFFRKKEPSYGTVSAMLTEKTVCCAGLVLAELLQGARTEKELDVVRAFTQVFEFLPSTPHIWDRAGTLCFSLRRKGRQVGLSDCLIAVMADHYKAILLTLDSHFKVIESEIKLKRHMMEK